ncbi:DUF2267 domain-containing protein [Bradymonadaceae bacterium TMQ3]|uniref:DUF2267 domain-containing protein n=1 Tax=Lujinxingia sediminis TaxID=2480984 RepID=A0ABY0CUU9_9DELT|nr:DUF2267 domain-containing protein [Lujinxingia sediminis]RDV37204.1 DUF2267 domain-containing protein [Bradymonadaceae bacterium TMQ3]RVU46848.1 DUF2267 domain-containing protein [Lujinxingia sediminis]TXC74857.1 DUF2267 domain-containing protein [Bradymonadales bacterium TMQ1]
MTYEILLMRVQRRSGIEDAGLLQELVHRVILELASGLSRESAEVVAERLPEPLASELRAAPSSQLKTRAASPPGITPTALYTSVGEALALDEGFAMEFSRVVCQVISESVGSERRTLLIARLGEDWRELFEPRKADFGHRPELAEEPGVADRTTRDALAEGRPGSAHPLSEGSAAQQDSIARDEEPHQGDRVATSRGKPARRTLAEGRPGSSRSINESGRHS